MMMIWLILFLKSRQDKHTTSQARCTKPIAVDQSKASQTEHEASTRPAFLIDHLFYQSIFIFSFNPLLLFFL
jgi:hypothetical protein